MGSVLAQRPAATPAPGTSRPATAQSPGGPVERARAALAAGRATEAIALAQGVLAKTPGDRGAADVVIRALSGADDIDGALAAYERFVGQVKTEDAALLAPVAVAMLARLSNDPLPELAAVALEHLARAGEARSAERLRALAASGGTRSPSVHALAALVRLGDEGAAEELIAMAASGPPGSRILAFEVLSRSAPSRVAPVLEAGLFDAHMLVQAAAIEAAGRTGARALLPALERVAAGASPFIRIHVAIAQHRMGVPGARARLDAALTGPYADAALLAATALEPSDPRRMAALRPLLDGEDRLAAVRAAAMLLRTPDRPAAMATLAAAIDEANPLIRGEAAAVLAADDTPETGLLHRLMRDGHPPSRLHASAGLVRSLPARP